MATILNIILFVVVVLVSLAISFWLFLGLVIFLGAAMIPDLHDDYPSNEDVEEYDRKKK